MSTFKHALAKFRFCIVIFVLLAPALPVQGATITVGTGCTIRQAIESANTGASVGSCAAGSSGADTITLSSQVNSSSSLPAVTSDITISGGGTIVAQFSGLFTVTAGSLKLDNIILRNASRTQGGSIDCHTSCASVTVSNSEIRSSEALSGDGGAIRVLGGADLTVTNTRIRDSTAELGGAIYFEGTGTLNISGSTFDNNSTSGGTSQHGGAIHIASSGSGVLIDTSGFGTNGARGHGGGVYSASGVVLNVRNSTFGGNKARGDGGGIYSSGTVDLLHVTMADNIGSDDDNDATSGTTGLHNNDGIAHIVNSILAGGTGGNTCKGPITIKVANIIEGGGCGSADTVNGDPSLGSRTTRPPIHYPLNSDSPAIGVGDTGYCTGFDQIGTIRDSNGCDLGAIEFEGTTVQPTAVPTAVPTADPGPQPTAVPDPARITGPGPAPGGSGGSAAGQSSSAASAAENAPVQTCEILMHETDIEVTDMSGLGVGYQCQRADATAVGDLRVIAMGLVDAVDVWGWIAKGVEVCFPQSGAAVFLDAAHAPRTLHSLVSYRNGNGMTCVEIDRAGTVALVEGSPTYDYDPSNQLSNCMVFTKNILNFRKSPGGEIKGLIPALVTLTALGRAPGWYQVDYWGEVGWISADYVEPQGDCGA